MRTARISGIPYIAYDIAFGDSQTLFCPDALEV